MDVEEIELRWEHLDVNGDDEHDEVLDYKVKVIKDWDKPTQETVYETTLNRNIVNSYELRDYLKIDKNLLEVDTDYTWRLAASYRDVNDSDSDGNITEVLNTPVVGMDFAIRPTAPELVAPSDKSVISYVNNAVNLQWDWALHDEVHSNVATKKYNAKLQAGGSEIKKETSAKNLNVDIQELKFNTPIEWEVDGRYAKEILDDPIQVTSDSRTFTVDMPINHVFRDDINGDGQEDYCKYLGNIFYCDLNQSESNFEIQKQLGTAGDIGVIGDLLGDGSGDLCYYRSGELFCEINGNQTRVAVFGTEGDIPMFGEVNGDGYEDLCIYRPNGVACALNNGDGTFDTRSSQLVTLQSNSMRMGLPALGDVDGDGLDEWCTYHNKTLMCFQNSGGSFRNSLERFESVDSRQFSSLLFGNEGDFPLFAETEAFENKDTFCVYRPSDAGIYCNSTYLPDGEEVIENAPIAVRKFRNEGLESNIFTLNRGDIQTLTDLSSWLDQGIQCYGFKDNPEGNLLRVYRFVNISNNRHFFTTSERLKNKLSIDPSWRIEDQAKHIFYIENEGECRINFDFDLIQTTSEGLEPVYLFEHASGTAFRYVGGIDGKDQTHVDYTNDAWRYKEVAFYAFDRQIQGSVPIRHYWSDRYFDAVYVPGNVINIPDYTHVGEEFYAFQTASNGSTPVRQYVSTVRPGDQDHFYKLSQAIASIPNFTHEKAAFYAFANPSEYTQTQIANADLEIYSQEMRSSINSGDRTYNALSIRNNGPAVAENVTLVHPIPSYASYVDSFSSSDCNQVGNKVNCTLGRMSPGATKSALIYFNFNSTSTVSVTATASVDSSTADSNLSNNSRSDSIVINGGGTVNPPPTTRSLKSVNRYEISSSLTRFFMIMGTSRADTDRQMSGLGYNYHNTAFQAYDPSDCQSGEQLVYRFKYPAKSNHFYIRATSASSARSLMSGFAGYQYEKPVFCVEYGASNGAKPVYRYYSPVLDAHYFSGNSIEISTMNRNIAPGGIWDGIWENKGVAWYAW